MTTAPLRWQKESELGIFYSSCVVEFPWPRGQLPELTVQIQLMLIVNVCFTFLIPSFSGGLSSRS